MPVCRPVQLGTPWAGAGFPVRTGAPIRFNAGRPKATGAVVAPSLHGVLMGGWHRRWNGPREAVEWQAARLKTVQRRKPLFASRRMHFLCGIYEPPFGGPLPYRTITSTPGDPPFSRQDRR
jgi:hypothetical protein